MSLKNPLDKDLPKAIKIGVWASIVSAVMLIGIGIFWVAHPAAAEGSFSIVPIRMPLSGFQKSRLFSKPSGM